jgi:hypothetical protein
MGAPARVLRREKCEAPRLTLVDNMGIGEDIVAEAQKQQQDYIDGVEPERLAVPVNRGRRREHRPKAERNGQVVTGHVNDVVMGVAELIQARGHYGYIKIVDANTVLVCNQRRAR